MNVKIHSDENKVWLEGIAGWSSNEKASSVHAALEAVMIALGEKISYDYLVGISSLAFRIQIGRLCPSSPHPACGYNCVERAFKVIPWNFKYFDVDQEKGDDLKNIYDIIIQSINKGIPVITGEEDDGLIIGYKKQKNEFIAIHPWVDNGKKTFCVSTLGEICWGIGVVTERKTKTIDLRAHVINSLKQAVKMANTKGFENYYVGLKAWEDYIQSLKKLNEKINDDDIIGNAWIYKCLVHYRDVAARYLLLIEDQFNNIVKNHLNKAATLYNKISQILKYDSGLENVTGEYNSLKKSVKWTVKMYQDQLQRLEKASPLEVQAINEIKSALSSI